MGFLAGNKATPLKQGSSISILNIAPPSGNPSDSRDPKVMFTQAEKGSVWVTPSGFYQMSSRMLYALLLQPGY